jgi:hypothetical protein
MIKFADGAIQVDARVIADGLGSTPAAVQDGMRRGAITGRCERGVDEDAGRYRLTFVTEHRRLRLVIDEAGNVLRRSTINFPAHAVTRRRQAR